MFGHQTRCYQAQASRRSAVVHIFAPLSADGRFGRIICFCAESSCWLPKNQTDLRSVTLLSAFVAVDLSGLGLLMAWDHNPNHIFSGPHAAKSPVDSSVFARATAITLGLLACRYGPVHQLSGLSL